MKRYRNDEEDEEKEEETKKMTRITETGGRRRRRSGEQRSGGGVVTVVGPTAFKPISSRPASSSSSTHPPRPLLSNTTSSSSTTVPHQPPPFSSSNTSKYLQQIRRLAETVLTSRTGIKELLECVMQKFITSPSKSCWEEECESIITILYLALILPDYVPKLSAKGTLVDFARRWFEDVDGSNLIEAFVSSGQNWRCSAYSSLLLLFANILPDECDVKDFEEILCWDHKWLPNTSHPPAWLINATSLKESILLFNALLYASAKMMKNSPVTVQPKSSSYISVMIEFLKGCRSYQEGDYEGGLKIFQGLKSSDCSRDLQGRILWLVGLCLVKLDKSHNALLKLQEAVDKCDTCTPAMFNISQVFSRMDRGEAELETLSLWIEGIKCRDQDFTPNLQSSILALHHPCPSHLSLRASYALASKLVEMKKYPEARKEFTHLLESMNDTTLKLEEVSKSLLRPEDNVPHLPLVDYICVLTALSHFECEEYETTLTILSQLENEDLEYLSFSEDSVSEKNKCIMKATGLLIAAIAKYKLGNNRDSLQQCLRVEDLISWESGNTSSDWEYCILLLKTLLYSTVSLVHECLQNEQSFHHYKRLAVQCATRAKDTNSDLKWKDLTLSDKLSVRTVCKYLKVKVSLLDL